MKRNLHINLCYYIFYDVLKEIKNTITLQFEIYFVTMEEESHVVFLSFNLMWKMHLSRDGFHYRKACSSLFTRQKRDPRKQKDISYLYTVDQKVCELVYMFLFSFSYSAFTTTSTFRSVGLRALFHHELIGSKFHSRYLGSKLAFIGRFSTIFLKKSILRGCTDYTIDFITIAIVNYLQWNVVPYSV